MGIDASIPLGLKPLQVPDQLNTMAQVMQIQGSQNQNAMAQYGLKKAQRLDDQQNALMSALQSGGLDLSTPEGQMKAISIAPDAAGPIIRASTEAQVAHSTVAKNTSQAGEADAKTTTAALGQYRDNLSGINDRATAANWVASQYADPRTAKIMQSLGPQDQAISRIPDPAQDPAGFNTWKQQSALGMAKYMELNKPTTSVVNAGGVSQVLQIPGLGGTPQTVAQIQHTVSPDAVLQSNTSIRNTNANIGKDYRVSGLNPDGTDPNGNVGGLSPEAVDNAARRYNFDGTLPPNMGRGTQGALETKRILTRAAALANVSPDDASGGRAGQMANKADASALTRLTQQQQLASSFERTANANADLALGLSKQMDRSGIPLINAGIQAWRTGTGSPEATQFAAANETFVNEYAKIMSGGMGNGPVTDSARSKAHTLLSTAMTPEQYAGNVKLLQTEMQNRMKGYGDQADEIRSRLRGVATPAPGGGAAGATPGGAPSGWGIQRVN